MRLYASDTNFIGEVTDNHLFCPNCRDIAPSIQSGDLRYVTRKSGLLRVTCSCCGSSYETSSPDPYAENASWRSVAGMPVDSRVPVG